MDVAVQVVFEIFKAGEEGAVSIASVDGWEKAVSEFAQAAERVAGIVMFVDHAGDGTIERHWTCFATAHRANDGKKNLFLFHDVAVQLRREPAKDGIDFNE